MLLLLGSVAFLLCSALTLMWQFPMRESAEVAAWVQAIGALMAIWVAVGLAYARTYSAEKEKKERANKLAHTYCGQVLLCVDTLYRVGVEKKWDQYRAWRKLLARAVDLPLDYAELAKKEIALVLSIGSIAVELLEQVPEKVDVEIGDFDALILLGAARNSMRDSMAEMGWPVSK